MNTDNTTIMRQFTPLPIDNTRGFPQTFSTLFEGQTYHFRLYVNVPAAMLTDDVTLLDLPTEAAFLVVCVEQEMADGSRELVFVNKVIPGMEYEFAAIALRFPRLRIARKNLNGQGDHGSRVTGEIATRWV